MMFQLRQFIRLSNCVTAFRHGRTGSAEDLCHAAMRLLPFFAEPAQVNGIFRPVHVASEAVKMSPSKLTRMAYARAVEHAAMAISMFWADEESAADKLPSPLQERLERSNRVVRPRPVLVSDFPGGVAK